MRVFVTGACGFIGSHLTERLLAEDHLVTAMAIYSARDTFGWLDEFEHEHLSKVRGDVRDAEQMRRLIKGHDIVFHLAALGSVPYSYDAPRSVFETNAIGTLNVLEACREAGAKLVHTSTSEVYGTAQYTPQDEHHPLQAQSPYAASKIAADKLVESYHLTYGLPCVILRPFNTYGPRQSERAVIPTIIRQALDPAYKEIHLGRMDTTRDFNYVGDTVRAFLAVMNLGGEYNAGSGMGYAVSTIATMVNMQLSRAKIVVSQPERTRPEKSEVLELCAATDIPGWESLETMGGGLQRTIDWWRTRSLKDRGIIS